MAVYTVHEPPLTRSEPRRGPEHFAFVRDGFYFWAFLLTPLWLLYRRLWLAFVVYAAVFALILLGLNFLRVGSVTLWFASLLLSALVSLEAATLLRRKLHWWGWREVGLVSGKPLEAAEQRFFDQWTRGDDVVVATPAPQFAPMTAAYVSLRRPTPGSSDIVGLFPEPGSPR